ncbi:MAG: helix-turn-helix domain-containing protein [Hespellia sp.]|nr:helix-turn-helix domain-containing protein [Hespellia sp.]
MSYSIYENINDNPTSLVNAFIVPIQSSAFHWHNEYEMIGLLKGEITVRMQSELISLKEGDILFVNPNVIHSIQSVEGQDNLCMLIQMKVNLFAVEENEKKDILFYLDSTSDEVPECGFDFFFRRMAKILWESMSDEKQAPFRTRAEVCTMIADLFEYVVYEERYKESKSKDRQDQAVLIMDYMVRNLCEEDVVDMACHELGLSRKMLDRNLKLVLGFTGKETINQLRIDEAKNLLKNTGKNMNYILDICGFGSEKTFYRLFRQETGLTPKKFREKGHYLSSNAELKDYLDFEVAEAKARLKQIIQE